MLVLTRARDSAIWVGRDVVVTVRDFGNLGVVLEVVFPAGTLLRGPQGVISTANDGGAAAGGLVAKRLVYLKRDEALRIGESISIMIVSLITGPNGGLCKVQLGFQAPADIKIMRQELREAGQTEGPSVTGEHQPSTP